MSVFWLLAGLSSFGVAALYSGKAGRSRFERLDERRARAVHESLTSELVTFLAVGGVAICLLGLTFSAITSSPLGALLWGSATLLQASSIPIRRRAHPQIVAAFESRGLKPLQSRETSAKRDRRQKQCGAVSLTAFVVGQVMAFFGERNEVPLLEVVAAVLILIALVALGALLWAAAWVYGDERRA